MLKKENIRKEKAPERESFPEVIHPAPRFNVLNRAFLRLGGGLLSTTAQALANSAPL
jgi:hypothetical protein